MPRESKKDKQKRALEICHVLDKTYPKSKCALNHDTPFQLLVATVLSAQTTDVAVNRATPALFADFPDAQTMSGAPAGAIEDHINSIGLWRNKAKFLRGLSKKLVEEFDGQIPKTINELTVLPGVARKTATAVLGTAMGIQAGVTVDTHMLRIMKLLKLSNETDAKKMSNQLEPLIPQDQWRVFTHRVIDHGRLVCVARRPRCGVCPIAELCPSEKSNEAGYKPENDKKEPASAKGLSWLT